MQFYANPCNGNVNGFYFETYDEFEKGVKKLEKKCIEEFSIEIIDGSCEEIQLVETLGLDQNTLESVLDVIENGDENDWPKLFFLLDNNITSSLEDAKDKVNDVSLHQGTLHAAACELFDDCYTVPPEIRNYIDYDKFAEDIELEGGMVEFEFGGDTYTCTNVNDL